MKRFWPKNGFSFVLPTLQTSFGKKQKKIFVGSGFDIFSDAVPDNYIADILRKCRNNPSHSYLFQSKNPIRFLDFISAFPQDEDLLLGTTLESNKDSPSFSKAPLIQGRVGWMEDLSKYFRVMISIEPIMDFDLNPFVDMIRSVKPLFVSIGADSKGHRLPEPPWDKVQALINKLNKFTEVRQKTNLERLMT
jgi:hypothetical protein